ncbi:MAG: hypothetical protein ABDH31_07970 [Chlorobiota bacterium]
MPFAQIAVDHATPPSMERVYLSAIRKAVSPVASASAPTSAIRKTTIVGADPYACPYPTAGKPSRQRGATTGKSSPPAKGVSVASAGTPTHVVRETRTLQ